MALNSSAPNTDFVQRTAEGRRITKTLVGDFTFDLFSDKHRRKVFLPRNMTKVLAFHDRNRTRGVETGTFRSSALRRRGPILATGVTANKGAVGIENANGVADRSEPAATSNDASDHHQDSSTAKPDIETMSPDCLKVRAQDGTTSEQTREKRRSVRHQRARQHEDKNAQLYFDTVSIRKKLNFKENTLEGDDRPRKRIRIESIPCHCHVTIWDNRKVLEQKEPIVRKSELCEVSSSDLGKDIGVVAEVKLRKPFIFKSAELKVPIETPRGTVLGIGDNYFLEVKIIPTKNDADWPPVPLLGRSEGDQTTGLGRLAAEKLQGTLAARYMHLPQAPASDVPLSVFFLYDGTTYRSKYGLEVSAMWTTGDVPEVMMKHEEDEEQIDLWKLDEQGHAFGRKDSPRNKETQTKGAANPRVKQTRKPPSPVKVTFNIDGVSAKGAKDFRKATSVGLRCPACPHQTFAVLEDLQFHFMNSHSKYKFSVEKQEFNSITNELSVITFKISTHGTARPRNQDREPHKNDKDLNWQAPPEPLDVPAYVNGNQDWVEGNWAEGPKKPEPAPAVAFAIPDTLSTIRSQQYAGFTPAQKGGFLPAEHVPPYREPSRAKYPNIKLRTMTEDKEAMYTSVSHRQVHADEDARSESDDEMDDEWFVKKSLEALDIAAEKQGWTNEQRILRRKWNRARLKERLSHPRYLSDCLVRFVRSEQSWLTAGGHERKSVFAEFIDEFLQRRVINQEVVRDFWAILHASDEQGRIDGKGQNRDTDKNDSVQREHDEFQTGSAQNLTARQQRAEAMLRLPPHTCAACVQPIEELRRHGLHCSEHECEAPGVWYHTRCVKCKRRDRLNWKCSLCTERIEELSTSKGKEVAAD